MCKQSKRLNKIKPDFRSSFTFHINKFSIYFAFKNSLFNEINIYVKITFS